MGIVWGHFLKDGHVSKHGAKNLKKNTVAKRLVGESLYSANAAVECGELVERRRKRDLVTLVVGICWKAEQVVVWAGRFLKECDGSNRLELTVSKFFFSEPRS